MKNLKKKQPPEIIDKDRTVTLSKNKQEENKLINPTITIKRNFLGN